jgi:tetratricopeptide (TPR) repeat protein
MRYQGFAIFLTLAMAAAAQQQPRPQPPQTKRDLTIDQIDRQAAPPQPVNIPRSYAVIIGIARYRNLAANQQLNFSERDAQSIRTVLISTEGGNFKAENVHVLLGDQATLANMRREIDNWLPSMAKEGDRVLIYFAGHGFMYEGKGYLAPADFDPNRVAGSGYPMDELASVIGSKIQATYKILMTDACHSGFIAPEDVQKINRTLSTLNQSLFSLTASRDREVSYESPDLQGGHGVFTYYVVEGMAGAADVNHDGKVTADELGEYVRVQVREATGGKQTPTSERGSYDPQMLLSYVPSNVKPATPPAPEFGTLVFESNMDDVEVFLDGKSIGVLSKDQKQLRMPGLQPGEHTIKGVRMGYEPDGPRPEMVYPGQDSTVTIKILIPRRRSKAAVDELDKGIEIYQKARDQNSYKNAIQHLEKALQLDPTYSQAAYYLGSSYNALFDEAKAEEYFKKAIQIDPDYLQARATYAGMLLDIGNVDEAIRQINAVLTRQPNHALALTMQAQAYRFKALYPDSIQSARQAIQLAPKSAEPHLWMADSLRLSGKCDEAKNEYYEYLKLSNFDTGMAGQLNYYVIGSLFGLGKRKRASQHDIWKDLRSLTYFGLCDCEKDKPQQLESAIDHCQKALVYDPSDPFAHFALAVAYMNRAKRDNNEWDLRPAEQHFKKMLQINPDLAQAGMAKRNLATIEKYYSNQ